jgi:hypothetical protein
MAQDPSIALLTDPWFEAHFYGYVEEGSWRIAHDGGAPLRFEEAQGLFLWCPCGYGQREKDGSLKYPLDLSLNHGRPHGLIVPFSNPPSGIPLPAGHGPIGRDGKTRPRWTVSGSGLNDLTITPSIAVGKDPECWHGFITAGKVK